ncbi:MAG: sugar transferase [Comamonas sp.]|nr:sugar transferase [Comamonas sp.]
MLKRLFDFFASFIGLLLLAPLLLLIALAIKLDSPGPVFFRQKRVGQYGELFRIHKFRSMTVDAPSTGLQITVGEDIRITRVGGALRKYKLDELAQLIDVLNGSMSLVGPRPEVPFYVDFYPDEIRKIVFSVKPGITDWASIKYKDENEILSKSDDPQRTYVDEVLPIKLRYYVEYVQNRSFFNDIKIIYSTLLAILR